MTKRVSSLVLAIVMLLQILVPQTTIAKEEVKSPSDKQVQIGLINGNSYDSKLMLELNRLTAKNRKKRSAEPGTSLFGYFDDGQEPKDEDKLKYHGEVKAELTVKGIDGGEFPWKDIFGNEEVHLRFSQINDETGAETGVERVLNVSKAGKYTWTDGEGNPAELPLFNNKLEPLIYEVKLDEEVSDKVKLLTARLTTTGDASPTFDRPDADGRIKYHLTLEIGLQQVASSKFVSEWHTAVAEGERPQLEATMIGSMDVKGNTKNKTIDFKFPTNNNDNVVVRTNSRRDKNKLLTELLYKTPITDIKTDTAGLTFDTTKKTVKSGDHKFKYDFNYDVINGGKLTMTEILLVNFDANGGKFENFTSPDTDAKITKEVEFDGSLTDVPAKPKKDLETFKGWSETKDGKPLSKEDFEKAIKNITEVKKFYAIWDNNDIVANQLEVKESFKYGTGYVNDFIPTLETLKGQVKIKDANGTPQALANDDTFAIVDGQTEYTTDEALKTYLYEKLQEKANPKGEPTRVETVKAKITHKNGTSQTVDIPIKVIKNIYEAKTKEGKPNYVPDGYVKVTVDPTTKAKDPQKYFYYVNPAAKVVIPGKDPVGTGDNKFVKWTMRADDSTGEGSEYKLADKPRTQFEKASTITAQYVSDVIPQEGNTKPKTVPEGFVEVKFVPTDKATDETKAEKIYWVNPDKEVTIPVKDPVGKQYFTFKEWKLGADAKGDKYTPSTPKKFTEATTITATYEEAKNIIPYDPKEPTTRPDGYIRVTFEAEEGLKLTEQKAYYVKKNAGIKLGNAELVKPGYEAQTGYKFDKWDKEDTTKIETTDIVVTAKATKFDTVIPEKDDKGNPNTNPAGYKVVTFVIKTGDESKGSITGVAKFYVNPTEYVTINPPDTKPNTGYEFGAWDKDATIPTVYNKDTTITGSFNGLKDLIPSKNPDGSKNKQPAGYKKVEFVIDPATGGKIADKEVTVYYVNPAKDVTVPQPKTQAETGYEFEKWDQDTTAAKKYDKDITVKGNFKKLDDIIPEKTGNTPNAKPNGYVTVTFDKGEHGKEITGQTVYYVNPKANPAKTLGDTSIVKPKVTPETGWEVNGWDKVDTLTITKDEIVTAKYKAIDDVIPSTENGTPNAKPAGYITVTFVKGENGKELTGQTVYYVNPNKAVVLKDKDPTAVPNTGYVFARWDVTIDKAIQYKDGDKITALYNDPGNISKTEVEGYVKVEFKPGTNGTLEGTTNYWIKPGVEVNIPAPSVKPNVGFEFREWDKSLTVTAEANDPTYEITADYTTLDNIIPKANTDGSDRPSGYHTVTFKVVNGTTSGQTVFYVNGEKKIDLTKTASGINKKANVGYTDEGVNWSPAITNKKYTDDAEYTFTFKELADVIEEKPGITKPDGYVKVEFVAGDNGSLKGGNKTYYVNPDKNITVGSTELPIPETEPVKNYKFDNWYEAINKTEPIKNDKKFVARFKLNKVTMTYDANGATEGTAPEALPYDIGTDITIAGGNNLKKDNAVLAGWKIGDKIYKPGEKFTINEDTTATAVWEAGLHTVEFDTDGAGHIPSQKVKHGEKITEVTNPQKNGYFFTGWTLDGQPFNPETDVVTKDITLVAQYSKDIIPQEGDNKPEGVPNSFVLVEFKPGNNGNLTGTTKYWVNPAAGKKLSDIVHPSVSANEEWKNTGWDKAEDTEIKSQLEVIAQYLKKVLTTEPTENAEKYVKVDFEQGEHGTIADDATKTYWVLKNEIVSLTAPTITPNTGYAQKANDDAWSPKLATSYSNDTTHIAQYVYNGENVISQKGNEKPNNVPKDFVLVEFNQGAHGTIASTETTKYWVNPNVLVTLTPPKVKANSGYELERGYNAWDKYLTNIFSEATTITAQYRKIEVPTPPTPEPGYPGGSDYPSYPGRPIPMYPEVRYETIIQEKIVKVPVPVSDNYFKEVRYMQGFNGYFRPNDGLTRAEAAQILANALVEDGYKYNPNFKISYKDIGEAWYTRAVKIVTEANVFAGYDDGNFKPQAKITRNEWIATLKRFQELGDASGNNMNLSDNHWAKGEIQAAFNEGWLKIYTDGLATYKGDEFIPRQEVAAVSNKAFKRIVDKTYIGKNNLSLVTYKDVNTSMWAYEDILCASNTFLDRKDRYIAHWVKEDKNQFNIDTSDLKIVQKNFQRNPR